MYTLMTKIKRLVLIGRLCGLMCLLQLLLSASAWGLGPRFFPQQGLLPLPIGPAYFYGLALSLGTLVFRPNQYTLSLVTAFLAYGFLADLQLLQAWSYQYFFFFGLLAWAQWQPSKAALVQDLLAIFMACCYLWAGLHKINPLFATEVFPWLMGIFSWTDSWADWSMGGYLIAIFEALLGLSFFFPKLSRYSRWLLIPFHLGILLFLFFDDWNKVVYPWNLGMPLLALLLFGQKNYQTTALYKQPAFLLTILIFGLLPSQRSTGYWPYPLSFSMYSACSTELHLGFSKEQFKAPTLKRQIPLKILETATYNGETYWLSVDDWSILEYELPSFSNKIYLRAWAKQFLTQSPYSSIQLKWVERKGLWPKEGKEEIELLRK